MVADAPSRKSPKNVRTEPHTDPSRWIELVPVIGLVASVVVSAMYGFPTGLVVIGATLLLTGIWNLWVSLQMVAGDRPVQTPLEAADQVSYEDEQKAYLLRALEDLEYERSVGKIDDEDYQALRQQFRTRAKAALASHKVDEGSRQRAEELARSFLENQGLVPADAKTGKESAP